MGIITGGIFSILEIAVRPAVGSVKQRFVHPFEIKRQGNSFTHPTIGKNRALNIKRQPARVLRGFVFMFVFNDIAFREIFSDIPGRPVFGAVLDT